MCGIAGFCLHPDDRDIPFTADIATALLLGIEERGTDATGMAWTDRKFTRLHSHKTDLPATAYVKADHAEAMGDDAHVCILHTRFATQGSPKHNVNNHPIKSGHVIGVHNGHLDNDNELFKELGAPRKGAVDSEAAFALLSYGKGDTASLLERLSGRAALAWIDRRDAVPTLHLARVYGSPLAVGQTAGGSLIFASTMAILLASMKSIGVTLEWTLNVAEGVYMQIRDGRVVSTTEFDVPDYRDWWMRRAGDTAKVAAAVVGKAKGKSKGKNRQAGTSRFTGTPRFGDTTQYDGLVWDEEKGSWEWDGDEMVYETHSIHRLTDDEFEQEMAELGGES